MITSVFSLLFIFLNPFMVFGDFEIEKIPFDSGEKNPFVTDQWWRNFRANILKNHLNILVYTEFSRTQKNAHKLPLSIVMVKGKNLTRLGKFRLTFPTPIAELKAQGLHLSLSWKNFHLNIYDWLLDKDERKQSLETLCRETFYPPLSYDLKLSKHTVNKKDFIAASYYLYQDSPDPEPKDPEFFALCFKNDDGRFTSLVFNASFSQAEKDFLKNHLMIF